MALESLASRYDTAWRRRREVLKSGLTLRLAQSSTSCQSEAQRKGGEDVGCGAVHREGTDVERFVAASKRFEPMMEAMGSRNDGVYEDENEPGLMSTMSEWDNHDQMHGASEKHGDQFNKEAGTEGLDWTTHIWRKRGGA